MLTARGYAVTSVTNGAAAVDVVRSPRPAAILLDLMMPGMSGWGTIVALRQDSRTVAVDVIALTALANDGHLGERRRRRLDHQAHRRARPRRRSQAGAVAGTAVTKVPILEDDGALAQVLTAHVRSPGADHLPRPDRAGGHRAGPMGAARPPGPRSPAPRRRRRQIVECFRDDARLARITLVVHTSKDLDQAERAELQLGRTEIFTKSQITVSEFEGRVAGLVDRVVRAKEREQARA